jgi:GR25 family glycosyltransferase involved in LPS biosynthesis
MDIRKMLNKSRSLIVKGPPTARNILFSQFDYWPTRRLRNEEIRHLPIYCVSLPTAIRRRRIIARQVQKMELTAFAFIDGFSIANLDLAKLQQEGLYDDAAANRFHGRSLTMSEISGSLSHGRAYDLIVSRGHEVSMVIEDDALFIPSRLDRVELDVLPAGWHIAFLNTFVENGRPRGRISGHLCHGDAYAGSAAAYLLSRNGAQRLAERYKPVVHAADGYAGRNDIMRLMYYPDCVLNGSVCHYYDSTVQGDRALFGQGGQPQRPRPYQ